MGTMVCSWHLVRRGLTGLMRLNELRAALVWTGAVQPYPIVRSASVGVTSGRTCYVAVGVESIPVASVKDCGQGIGSRAWC